MHEHYRGFEKDLRAALINCINKTTIKHPIVISQVNISFNKKRGVENHTPWVTQIDDLIKSDHDYPMKGTRRSATTLRILIIGLIAGPAVSL